MFAVGQKRNSYLRQKYKELIRWGNPRLRSHSTTDSDELGGKRQCVIFHHKRIAERYACGAGSADGGLLPPFWPSPIVSAVSPAMLPSCMLSTAVLGTMTMVEFCFSPSYSMFIA